MADSKDKAAEGGQDKSKDKTVAEAGKAKDENLDNLTPEELEAKLKELGLLKVYEKTMTSKVDQRVTQAVKTTEERLAKEKEDSEAKAKEEAEAKAKAEEEKNMSETEKEVSALKSDLAEVTTMFKEYMGKDKTDKLNVVVLEALKEAELPESWMDRVKGDTPDEIKKDIAMLTKDFTTVQQSKIDEALETKDKPLTSKGLTDDGVDTRIDKYLKSQDQPLDGKIAEQLELNK